MLALQHKKLDVWKLGMNLVKAIYKLTKCFPKEEMFCLTNQIRRAVISVPSNISEGASRKSKIERKRFYEISRSSLVEIDTQIEIALLLEYVEIKNINDIEELMSHLFSKLSRLIDNP